MSDLQTTTNGKSRSLFFLILFLSGFAGLINQVVWQRAIKVYLGGADAICSMLVVLVFMLGIGIGSLLMGKKASTLKNPIGALAKTEFALFVVNLIVLALLLIDLSDSIFAFQRAAISFGIPITLLYSITGIAILILPCLLIGMTMPIASEGANRQLQFKNSWMVDHMFFINTLGAFAGAILTGFKLLPIYGQTVCLILAALFNLSAAILLSFLKSAPVESIEPSGDSQPACLEKPGRSDWWQFRDEEIATFFLGFVSLAYEMYLFRAIALVYKPLPYTFSMILSFFLLAWAIGVLMAGYLKDSVLPAIIIGSLTIFLSPYVVMYDRVIAVGLGLIFAGISYYIPCIMFGLVFGQLLNRFIKNWGSDVGKFMGLNTFGSCLGILAMTLVGGNIFHAFNAWILGTIMAMVAIWLYLKTLTISYIKNYCGSAVLLLGFISISLLAVEGQSSPHIDKVYRTYSDPVGVTEIANNGDLIWDGLWHSKLSDGKNHIGQSNWMHAVVPALCTNHEIVDDVLVIGVGTGITIGTLARSSSIKNLEAYDINKSLKLVMTDFPAQTLNVLTNPRIRMIWQDARSGLALNEKKYQIITQQPLYLKQAGSSNLLSEEYLRLVAKRLADDGIFLVYANSQGNREQQMVVRKTLESVFPHCVSFLKGYMYVVSKSPIVYPRESIEKKLAVNDDLVKEIKSKFTTEQM
ncbi:MAG: hypothetical protein EOM80_11005, partial [Erysipelotrichia bacterium]|nr:hypothetical protein [Erysipelotrichia bacterium]